MAENPELHRRLIARQTDAELERKWRKAEGRWSNQYWAQEWLDVADRRAQKMSDFFKSQEPLGEPFASILHDNAFELYAR